MKGLGVVGVVAAGLVAGGLVVIFLLGMQAVGGVA